LLRKPTKLPLVAYTINLFRTSVHRIVPVSQLCESAKFHHNFYSL